MESEGFKRELSAIRILNDLNKLIFNLIKRNRDKLVDSIGDNLLAKSSSVVDTLPMTPSGKIQKCV